MPMSRRDFEAIADMIGNSREYFGSNTGHAQFASDMAKVCAEANNYLDRPKFIMACMPKAWVGSNKANPWERLARTGNKVDA